MLLLSLNARKKDHYPVYANVVHTQGNGLFPKLFFYAFRLNLLAC